MEGITLVLKSPGLAPHDARIAPAPQAGVPVKGELGLFAEALAALKEQAQYAPKVLAITGTNGKTTTTCMTALLVERAGLRGAWRATSARPCSTRSGPRSTTSPSPSLWRPARPSSWPRAREPRPSSHRHPRAGLCRAARGLGAGALVLPIGWCPRLPEPPLAPYSI